MFDVLVPEIVIQVVESGLGVRLDGMVSRYSSYINRVFGLRDLDGNEIVVKFYRPGRWSEEALEEEHRFLQDCLEAEIPVITPIADEDGDTLRVLDLDTPGGEVEVFWAAFPKRGGRNFDAEGDEEWFRLGSIVGRLHQVGLRREAHHRVRCGPAELSAPQLRELLSGGLMHSETAEEFREVCESALEVITPLFSGVPVQRIHGDCHRGNILDRPGDGLLIIDFDDMMVGPPVQDLWLLLPDHVQNCGRELAHLVDGYRQFSPFDEEMVRFVEPLRFMRMLHYLHWQAKQHEDRGFLEANPGWGSKAFWITRIEDLRDQLRVIVSDG